MVTVTAPFKGRTAIWALFSILSAAMLYPLLPLHSAFISNGTTDILIGDYPILQRLIFLFDPYLSAAIAASFFQLSAIYLLYCIAAATLDLDSHDSNTLFGGEKRKIIIALMAIFMVVKIILHTWGNTISGTHASNDIVVIFINELCHFPTLALLCGPCLSIAKKGNQLSCYVAIGGFLLFFYYRLSNLFSIPIFYVGSNTNLIIIIHTALLASNIIFTCLLRTYNVSIRTTIHAFIFTHMLSSVIANAFS